MSLRISAPVVLCLGAALSLGLAAAACSSSSASGTSTDGGGSADTSISDTGADTALADGSAVDGGADAGGLTGSGTVAGSVGGTGFGQVYNAFLIGAPDLATSTAVYLVGKPGVACSDIGQSGWSHLIPTGVPIFEMILITQTPAAGTYAVSAATAPGSAEVNYIVSAPARNETRATAGTITLSTLTPNVAAAGTFSVQFPGTVVDGGDAGASAFDGTFNAVYCAAGHEP